MIASGPHHGVPMTQAQIAQHAQAQAAAAEMAKRRSRKPTDKAIPEGVEDAVIDPEPVALYNKLRAYERRLDATLARKRLDMTDSFPRYPKVRRTLRVWVTNTAEGQSWQVGNSTGDTFSLSANVEASYRVKIEGRLVDDEFSVPGEEEKLGDKSAEKAPAGSDGGPEAHNVAKPSTKPTPGAGAPRNKFSHFFKSMTVDFPAAKGDQTVEWKKPDRAQSSAANLPAAADFDEVTFKRGGDENMNITINLFRHEEPERFKLSSELAEIVDMEEASRHEVLTAIWEYVKLFGLQEDEEKRNFRCDEALKKVRPRHCIYTYNFYCPTTNRVNI